MGFDALDRRAREARAWLHEACFPLWASAGVNAHGVFRECLGLDHETIESETTRVRAQARQTYVFTEALRQGWQPKLSGRLIDQGLAVLKGPALRADHLACRTVSADGAARVDETADLYDVAFVLFALAEARSVLRADADARIANTASAIVRALGTVMRSASGGFAEVLPAPSVRLQNPHMHLLEACLSLRTAGLEADWAEATLKEILSLFETRFTAGPGRLLGEKFAADWSAPEGEAARIVEPGHQFEWVWLLLQAAPRGATPVETMRRLYDFAISTRDAAGHAVMEVTRDGAAVDKTSRTWAQTEALKASLALMEVTGDELYARHAVQAFDVLMDRFLTPDGGWHDHFDGDGKLLARNMPASTGYHVVLAFSELMRVCAARE